MKIVLFLVPLLSLDIYAETVNSEVFQYDPKYKLVKFTNGRVAKAGKLNFATYVGKSVEVIIDDSNVIEKFKVIQGSGQILKNKIQFMENAPAPFEPTILPNYRASLDVFERLNSDYVRRSECTDRAHVWAYNEYKNNGINSMKVFVFFTASYINKNDFKWWFHVAPLVKVKEDGKIVDRVLDYQFLDRPVTVKEWTDLQVFSKRECKVTTKFSEYDVNPQTEDCYLIYESMYYRLPGDIHAQELRNEYRNSFSEAEVKFAEKMGFKKTNGGI